MHSKIKIKKEFINISQESGTGGKTALSGLLAIFLPYFNPLCRRINEPLYFKRNNLRIIVHIIQILIHKIVRKGRGKSKIVKELSEHA